MLGCFFYDEDQIRNTSDWSTISNPYNYLNKNYDLYFNETFLWGYCVEGTEGDSNFCLGGVNNGEPCTFDSNTGLDNGDCYSQAVGIEGGKFTPDATATTNDTSETSDAASGEMLTQLTSAQSALVGSGAATQTIASNAAGALDITASTATDMVSTNTSECMASSITSVWSW